MRGIYFASLVFLSVVASHVVGVTAAEFRIWEDITRRFRTEAQFISLQGGNVQLKRRDGTVVLVPLEKLSNVDQEFARRSADEHGSPQQSESSVRIQASKTNLTVQMREALTRPTEFEFTEMPISRILMSLSEKHAIPIIIDTDVLDVHRLDSDMPITSRNAGALLGDSLDDLLSNLNLTWEVRDEVLWVTSSKASGCEVTVYRAKTKLNYPVSLATKDITTRVQPQTWAYKGGRGTIEILRLNVPQTNVYLPERQGRTVGEYAIVITQTQAVHRDIQRQFAGIIQPIQAAVPTIPPALVGKARANALNERIDITFTETPLREVVELLATHSQLQMNLDDAALRENEININQPVTMDIKGIRLCSALSLLLRPLGLVWLVEADAIHMTIPDKAKSKLVRIAYPSDVFSQEQQFMTQLLTTSVEPQTWSQVGGNGTIESSGQGPLIVGQTFDVHRRIIQLVADLHEAHK